MRSKLLLVPLVIAAALVLAPGVAAGGGGCHQPPSEGTTDAVRLQGNCFAPAVVRVDRGTTVRWEVDRGDPDHTVSTFDWTSDVLRPGDAFSHRFEEAGVFPYYCALHPGMVGAVIVGDADATRTATVPVSSQGASDSAWWAVVVAALVAGGGGFVAGRVNGSRRGA